MAIGIMKPRRNQNHRMNLSFTRYRFLGVKQKVGISPVKRLLSPGVSIRPREARMLGFLVLRRHEVCNKRNAIRGFKMIFEETYNRNHPPIILKSKGSCHLHTTEASLQSYGPYDARTRVLSGQLPRDMHGRTHDVHHFRTPGKAF